MRLRFHLLLLYAPRAIQHKSNQLNRHTLITVRSQRKWKRENSECQRERTKTSLSHSQCFRSTLLRSYCFRISGIFLFLFFSLVIFKWFQTNVTKSECMREVACSSRRRRCNDQSVWAMKCARVWILSGDFPILISTVKLNKPVSFVSD